jgi:hypothetical protein
MSSSEGSVLFYTSILTPAKVADMYLKPAIAYAVLALTSLSVGYVMGAQSKKGGLVCDVVGKPSISEEDRDLSGEKPSMAEDCKMVRTCSN